MLRFRVALALLLFLPGRALAIVSSNADPQSIFDGVNINQLIGAETFYSNGYWGDRAIIANVEAGNVWNGHQTLGQVTTYVNGPSISSDPTSPAFPFDWHATMVGETLVGRMDLSVQIAPGLIFTIPAPDSYFYTATASDGTKFNWSAFTGIAPNATLWSSAIATSWNFSGSEAFSGSFNTDTPQVLYSYKTTMQTGLPGAPGVRADVVNSSWGYDDSPGQYPWTVLVDALAYANHNTVVMAAGNGGGPPVVGPASGYNTIAVAAMSSDTSSPVYGSSASFTSTGPNDFYNPQTGVTSPGVRAKVDIAAPGDNLTLAAYGGLTGGHNPTDTDPTGGLGYYYFIDVGGTSFASPIVAGGAALLVDAGKAHFGGGNAIDGRVIKAVLLNSADKTAGWNNGQTQQPGSLVITTTQNLDYAAGAGRINLNQAYHQYLDGTAAPGLNGSASAVVDGIGWDFGQVSRAAPINDYYISQRQDAGTPLTVTLDWFADRSLDPLTDAASDVELDDLDLQVWKVSGALPTMLVAESFGIYNNVDHLYFDLPSDGDYLIRVIMEGAIYNLSGDNSNVDQYGLAWAVPEPSSGALFAVAAAVFGGWWSRRRKRGSGARSTQHGARVLELRMPCNAG